MHISWRWQLVCLLLVVIVSSVGLLCQIGDLLKQHGLAWPTSNITLAVYLPGHAQDKFAVQPDRLLEFQVCNGFANQRLSLAYGLLLAALTNRTAVLPDLIPSGVQYTTESITPGTNNAYSFGTVYNTERFFARIVKTGVRIVPKSTLNHWHHFVNVTLERTLDAAQLLNTEYQHTPYVAVDCPLFRLPASYMVEHEDVVWDILDGLWPSPAIMPYLNTALDKLTSLSRAGHYNFLHLRAERDWVAHCERWSNIPDGVVRDNCMNNTYTVDDVLQAKHIPTQVPLYVASFWKDVDETISNNIFARLKAAGYSVHTQNGILGNITDMPRETLALVEFYLALHSERFMGNSVSTFSAMLIYERRHAGLWAAYYNTGNIPLAQMLPLDKLPWVFTYNSWSSNYDYMLKAALRSALKHGGLKPYCLFSGNASSAIYHFLVSSNVIMMSHRHTWAQELVDRARPFMRENLHNSHLYESPEALVGAFQRIDIPVLPALDQYDHVLYTDADVFFHKRFTLADFGTPLPFSVGMTWEMQNRFPFNSGVMLLNITELHNSYEGFLEFILNNTHGMMFPGYGPVDQGAYNQFYEASIRTHEISQSWNVKPYHAARPGYSIVHFHGPKPHDYLLWAETGTCHFDNLCKDGFKFALCTYIEQWFPYVSEVEEAQRLLGQCIKRRSSVGVPPGAGAQPSTQDQATAAVLQQPAAVTVQPSPPVQQPPSPEVANQALPSPHVSVQLSPSPGVANQAPPSPQAIAQSSPSPEVVNQAPPSPQASVQLSPSPEVANQAPPSPQVSVQLSPSPGVANQALPSPQAITQSLPSPEVANQAPPSPQVSVQLSPSPEVANQAPPSPQAITQSSPSPEVVNQAPPSPQASVQLSPSPKVANQAPPSPQVTVQLSPSPEVANQQPSPSGQQQPSPAVATQAPPSPQAITQPSPSPEVASQAPPSPPASVQLSPSPGVASQALALPPPPVAAIQAPPEGHQAPPLTSSAPGPVSTAVVAAAKAAAGRLPDLARPQGSATAGTQVPQPAAATSPPAIIPAPAEVATSMPVTAAPPVPATDASPAPGVAVSATASTLASPVPATAADPAAATTANPTAGAAANTAAANTTAANTTAANPAAANTKAANSTSAGAVANTAAAANPAAAAASPVVGSQ